jgi:hypothetical protein
MDDNIINININVLNIVGVVIASTLGILIIIFILIYNKYKTIFANFLSIIFLIPLLILFAIFYIIGYILTPFIILLFILFYLYTRIPEDKRKYFINILNTKISRFTDIIIYQLNILYANEFSYYEFFLIVIFMTLILVVGIILYWDHVYRTAKKLSRCSKINMIAYQNRDKDKYPFVYVIMIINESNLDAVLDKYVLKLEYNFVKKTTNAILGETEYVNEVLLVEENISTAVSKIDAVKTASKNYDDANALYPTDVSSDICNLLKAGDHDKTKCDDKLNKQQILNGAKNLLSAELAKSQFTYFDLGRMQSKKLESINKTLITDRKYKYICMTPDNKILKTEIARELATFVRDFGMNDKTDIYPLHSVLTAVEKSKEVNV